MRSKEEILVQSCKDSGAFLIIGQVIDGSPDAALNAMDEYAKEVHWGYKKWIDKIVEDDGLLGQYKYMSDEQLFDEFLKSIA